MIFRFDEFELDAEKLVLTRKHEAVRADALVLRLLSVLVEQAGELVTKRTLVARVWGDRVVSENVITVAMTRLRKTLGQAAGQREFVVNVHGRGYRFVREVTAIAPPPAATLVRSLRGLPFVGRDRVLDDLRGALSLAKSGHGSVAVLMGEAGIGKTSVAEVLEGEARAEGFAVVWGHCKEAGHTPPLWPFVQAVRGLREAARGAEDEPRLAGALSTLGAALPELDGARSGERADGEAASHPPAVEHRLLDAMARVITLVAERVPCAIVLDDLQNADSASLEMLRYVTGEISRSRVLLVATLRKGVTPDAPGDRHLAHVLGHRNTTRLELRRLEEVDVLRYVTAVVDDPAGSTAHVVFLKSEGNPFFMAELVRLLKSGAARDGATLSVPSAALDLLRQRLNGLDPASRDLLSVASVLGNQFDLPLLQSLSGVEPAALMASLDAALAAEIALPANDSRTSFRFGHDLLRGLLYDDLPGTRRRSLHRMIVDALAEGALAGRPRPPSELAYHAYAALPEGDARAAVRYCAEAAGAAASLRAYADAIRYLKHAREALELVPHASARLRLTLLLQQAWCARASSSMEFEATVREAMTLARAQGSASSLAQAALLLDLHPGFPAFSGARAALEEALESLSPSDDVFAAALGRLAICAPAAYDIGLSSERLEQGIALARSSRLLLSPYTVECARLYSRGGPAHAAEEALALAAMERLCAENPGVLSVTPALLSLHRAIRSAQRGALPAAAEAVEACATRCRQLGHHELFWHAERFRILSRVNADERDGVAAALREHHRRGQRDAIVGREVFVAHDEAVVLASAPDPEAGVPVTALAFQEDDPPSIWSLKVRALSAAHRLEEARQSLRRIRPAALGRLPCDRDFLGTLGALAHASLALGELEYAEAIAALLSPYEGAFCIHVAYLCEGSVSHVLGSIADALGRSVDAAAWLDAGADLDERAGFLRSAREARATRGRSTSHGAQA